MPAEDLVVRVLNEIRIVGLANDTALVTGYDVPEYRQAAAQFGAEAFFVKESLKWDEIKALIESIEKTIS